MKINFGQQRKEDYGRHDSKFVLCIQYAEMAVFKSEKKIDK